MKKILLFLSINIFITYAALAGITDILELENIEIKASELAQLVTLEKMGWQYNKNIKGELLVQSNDICSLNVNQVKDNLIISFDVTKMDNLITKVSELLEDRRTFCLYKMKLKEAFKTSINKIKQKKDYNFGYESGTFCKVESDEWISLLNHDDYPYIEANKSPYQSLESIYASPCKSDCAAGIQIINYMALYELFGKRLNRYFNRDEVVLGNWDAVRGTNGVFWGKRGKDRPIERKGVLFANHKLNKYDLIGVNGVLANVMGEAFLDSKADRNENFTIFEISNNAIDDLNKHGIEYFNDLLYKAWEFRQNQGWFERDKVNKILNVPFLTETYVYVFPLRNMSLKDHVIRQLKINKRTSYRLNLYKDNFNTFIFKKYIDININEEYKLIKNYKDELLLKIKDIVLDENNEWGIIHHIYPNNKYGIRYLYGEEEVYRLQERKNIAREVQSYQGVCYGKKVYYKKYSHITLPNAQRASIVTMFENGIIHAKDNDNNYYLNYCDLGYPVPSLKEYSRNDLVITNTNTVGKILNIYSNGLIKLNPISNSDENLTKVDKLYKSLVKISWLSGNVLNSLQIGDKVKMKDAMNYDATIHSIFKNGMVFLTFPGSTVTRVVKFDLLLKVQ